MREGAPAFIGRLEERPLGAARPLLPAGRLDQAALLEHIERAVDERAADRPDTPDIAVLRHRFGERPSVGRRVREQSEDGPLAGRQLAHFRHGLKGYCGLTAYGP